MLWGPFSGIPQGTGKRERALGEQTPATGGRPTHSIRHHLASWERELVGSGDPDTDFILGGIRDGFRLTSAGSNFSSVEMENYNSTTSPEAHQLVHDQIKAELDNGRYQITSSKPTIVSALGAIPKEGNKIRLIHDCSRPEGFSLNSFAETDPVRFQSVSEAASKIKPNYFMAKIDLESAYRSVPIHEDDYQSTGLKWWFKGDSAPTYLYDTRLPFGAKRAPGIFHRLTQAVRRMMARRGFWDIVMYLDDWLIIAPSKAECRVAMETLLGLLRNLGFAISYKKVTTPTESLTFLGINIDSVDMLLTLPLDKADQLQELIAEFARKRHASLRQLQTLAGKLSWASHVVRGGRPFLRRIFDLMANLQQARHKVKLSEGFYEDIGWWCKYFETFHGKPLAASIERCTVAVESDSCSTGMGAVSDVDWLFLDWEAELPTVASLHINHKEAAAVVVATRQWAHRWVGKHIVFNIDNQAAMGMLNKGSTVDPTMMGMLREMFWWSATHNFTYEAVFLAGQANLLADTASRLIRGDWLLQWALLSQVRGIAALDKFVDTLHLHVPEASLLLLLPQVRILGSWRRDLTIEWRNSEHRRLRTAPGAPTAPN